MPGLYLAQVVLAAQSSIPRDVAVNTFHVYVDGTGDATPRTDEEVIMGVLDGVPDINGPHGDISDIYGTLVDALSPEIDPTLSRIKWYLMSDPTPRVPRVDEPMDPWTPTTVYSGMPSEVAIVSSFEAAKLQGANQASRRNRVYIGPLSNFVLSPSNPGRLPTAVVDLFAGAFENFAQNSETQDDWEWRVYSDKLGESYPIVSGWVDDAFDSQRRRGVEATMRNTWTQNS